MAANKFMLLIGTKRGLFIGYSNARRKTWDVKGPFLTGEPIYCAVADQRKGCTILAGANSWHWGPSIHRSNNFGKTWSNSKKNPGYPKKSKATVEAIWQIEPDHPEYPNSIYAGVAPAGLFHSTDNGETWNEVKGLGAHPTRKKWAPGAGGLCLHTILVNPDNSNHLIAGISAVGVFESYDRGRKWELANQNLPSVFHPKQKGGPTSCVHKIAFAGGNSNRIYQQNHVGVYRRDGKRNWTRINNKLPSDFGFPLAAHPHKPDSAFVIPLKGGEFRSPVNGDLAVYKTTNAGKTWMKKSKGLPKKAYVGILRDSFSADPGKPCGLYFGTTGGHLFGSNDEGNSWFKIADYLPQINSVKAYEL